ncbi:MAG TPA: hypothetical protein VGQ52_16435, partial [Gemmatimonadaceae bacterium]|nr:hypothetical protein [Gemmatimonadaceae bacterium]
SLRAQRSTAYDSNFTVQKSSLATPVAMLTAHAAPPAGRVPVGITRRQADALGLGDPQGQGAHIGAGSNLALMGTGGAGVVVGLLVGGSGGTAIALGGGILGLVGLYRYLR